MSLDCIPLPSVALFRRFTSPCVAPWAYRSVCFVIYPGLTSYDPCHPLPLHHSCLILPLSSLRGTGEDAWLSRNAGHPSSRPGWRALCLSTTSTSTCCAACLSCRATCRRTRSSMASLAWSGECLLSRPGSLGGWGMQVQNRARHRWKVPINTSKEDRKGWDETQRARQSDGRSNQTVWERKVLIP